ncbi:hypothetical protein [Terrisporobacter glycolicus]|uniref:hypothetical protein n=1 Tax=Terrisporobacter petrolearius TaxID=1460447 RepID=UPI0011DDCBCF
MKNLKKKIASLALASVMTASLTISSFAAGNSVLWGGFQKDNTHNGVIDTATYTGAYNSNNFKSHDLENGWVGVDSSPVVGAEGNKTYAYILYSAKSTTNLTKIDCDNPAVGKWEGAEGIAVTNSSNFQLSTPALVGNSLYFGTTGFGQMAKNADLVNGSTESWTKLSSGAAISAENNYVKVSGNGTASLTQNLELAKGRGNRVASAIKLASGSSATLRVYSGNTQIATKTISGTDWNYLNENVSAFTAGGKFDVKFELTVNGTAYVDYCRIFEEGLQIKKVVDVTAATPKIETVTSANIGGQIDTPIVVDGNRLYFGTYTGSKSYYQIDLNNGDKDANFKAFTPSNDNFYWAGALTDKNGHVYFGSDSGKIYGGSKDSFDKSTEVKFDLKTKESNAGEVRSTLMSKDGYMYFTSKGGYLWCLKIESNGNLTYKWHKPLDGASTSTPVISNNGYLYVGYYNGFTSGGVKAFDVFDPESPRELKGLTTGPVQSSLIAYSEGATDYVYFTTNAQEGAGYCYGFDGENFSKKWNTGRGTYTLQGMASGNGYLVFGNDHATIYTIKK